MTQMKVRIDAGGREVEIECGSDNVSPEQVADKVLAMWQATDGVKAPGDGPASFGVSMERTRDRDPSSTMRVPMDVPQ